MSVGSANRLRRRRCGRAICCRIFEGLTLSESPSAAHTKVFPPSRNTQRKNRNLAVAAAKIPTLEKAVQALPIGGVNARGREILVGSRSIHEGDLLVLESGGSHFVVWVQSVEERGVLFCDIDLQKHILRPVGSAPKGLPVAAAPKELPGDPAYGIPDISHFLNKDAQQ